MTIETLAVRAVMRAISRTRYLVPFFNANDKEPIWDGYVAVYNSAVHTVNTLLLRVPVQIKGQKGATDRETINYPVRLADLRRYPKENPTAYFVVRLDNDTETVYCCVFQKEEAEKLVREKGTQETVSVKFQWMETLCDAEREQSLRLLLERDEDLDAAGEAKWEQELYLAGNEVRLRRARYEKLLQLPRLEDKPLRDLILAFAAALQKRDENLPSLTEQQAGGLMQKLNEIDPELRRPLYAMILTDAFLRDAQAAHWKREKLLEQLVTREREQLKKAVKALQGNEKRLDTALYHAALSLRRMATALGASGDRELKELLALT